MLSNQIFTDTQTSPGDLGEDTKSYIPPSISAISVAYWLKSMTVYFNMALTARKRNKMTKSTHVFSL